MLSLATRYSSLAALLLATTLVGCVRSRVTHFDPNVASDPRTPPEQIKFYSAQRPTCPFKEIGSVTTESRFLASWSSVVKKAREKAFEIGGDAIVGVNEKTRISGAVLSEGGVSTTENTSISGTVIRFTRPNCRE
jgi:hypothetical protein